MRITRMLAYSQVALGTACAGQVVRGSEATVRAEIEHAISRSVEATRTQDIEAYMAGIPNDLVIHDESGAVVTRGQLRANTLRDWSIIPRTIAIEVAIDSLAVDGDTATVFTSQRWERLMLQRDGSTTDTVLTTQKHRETWHRTPRGWMAYDVEELGGDVFINGKPHRP